MYLDHVIMFRANKKLYLRFKEFIKVRAEIDNFSHGCRIALIQYMKNYRPPTQPKNEIVDDSVKEKPLNIKENIL